MLNPTRRPFNSLRRTRYLNLTHLLPSYNFNVDLCDYLYILKMYFSHLKVQSSDNIHAVRLETQYIQYYDYYKDSLQHEVNVFSNFVGVQNKY